MRIVSAKQGDAEWLEARRGRVSASRVADAIAMLKNGKGETKARADYRDELISEVLTGQVSEHYVSGPMLRGTEQEPYARGAYEARFETFVDQVGFVLHPTIDDAGASPDGLIDEDGGIEIKVPLPKNHIAYMQAGVLPVEYEPQVMWNLACTGRKWWDFVSFCPEVPVRYRIFRFRVQRNDERIAEMEDGVRRFLSERDEVLAKLREDYPEIEEVAAPAVEDPLGITQDDIDWIKADHAKQASAAQA